MNLEKFILVDADQIVSVDIMELVDLDLHSVPYGYTPMGDDNAEIEGVSLLGVGLLERLLPGLAYLLRYVVSACS